MRAKKKHSNTFLLTICELTIRNYEFSMKKLYFHHNQLTAGNANPRAERQNAPNKLMNNSRFGIATASKTI